MSHTARLELDGTSYDLPVVEGTEHELGIDISKLRSETGFITLDDGYGNQRIGFEGSTTIVRSEFGITFNAALETGGVLVSDKIQLELEVSAIKQA